MHIHIYIHKHLHIHKYKHIHIDRARNGLIRIAKCELLLE